MLEWLAPKKTLKAKAQELSHPLNVMNVIIIKKNGRLSLCEYGIMGEMTKVLIQYLPNTDLSRAVTDGIQMTGHRYRVHIDESVDTMPLDEADAALAEILADIDNEFNDV